MAASEPSSLGVLRDWTVRVVQQLPPPQPIILISVSVCVQPRDMFLGGGGRCLHGGKGTRFHIEDSSEIRDSA